MHGVSAVSSRCRPEGRSARPGRAARRAAQAARDPRGRPRRDRGRRRGASCSTKVAQRCVFCGATAPGTELREFASKLVCEPCVEKLTASGGVTRELVGAPLRARRARAATSAAASRAESPRPSASRTAPRRRPSSSTATADGAPADDDHVLAARLGRARQRGRVGERRPASASSCSFVSSRATHDRPVAAARRGEVGERRRDAVGRLEEHDGARLASRSRRAARCAAVPLRGRNPSNTKRSAAKPGEHERGERGARPGHDLDREPARRGTRARAARPGR